VLTPPAPLSRSQADLRAEWTRERLRSPLSLLWARLRPRRREQSAGRAEQLGSVAALRR